MCQCDDGWTGDDCSGSNHIIMHPFSNLIEFLLTLITYVSEIKFLFGILGTVDLLKLALNKSRCLYLVYCELYNF